VPLNPVARAGELSLARFPDNPVYDHVVRSNTGPVLGRQEQAVPAYRQFAFVFAFLHLEVHPMQPNAIRLLAFILLSICCCVPTRAEAEPPEIKDNANVRKAYVELSNRLSMDVMVELAEIDAVLMMKKLKTYSQLAKIEKETDQKLADIAQKTAKIYTSLEGVHFLLEPKKSGEVPAALFLAWLSEARLANDNRILFTFQKETWPELIPYAKKLSGPKSDEKIFAEQLKLYRTTGILAITNPLARSIGVINTSKTDLANCTLVVQLEDIWGISQNMYYFLDRWEAGAEFKTRMIPTFGAMASCRLSLYCDQLTKDDKKAEQFNFSSFTKSAKKERDYCLETFVKGATFAGTWANNRFRTTGFTTLEITKVTSSPLLFNGPLIEGVISDTKARVSLPVEGTIRATYDNTNDVITGYKLVLRNPKNQYNLVIKDGEIVGNDNFGNELSFSIK
jgi:hypothetical protein